jgi:hypothetical protein
MFPKKNTFMVEGLEEFFDVIAPVSSFQNAYGGDCEFFKDPKLEKDSDSKKLPILWFRGHSNMEWNLEPNLYRKLKHIKTNDDFWRRIKDVENITYEEFEVRNFHLLDKPPVRNKYLWLSLMQHYNMVTRLLDWSEQAITALFFAVSEYFKADTPKVDHLPCVWVMKPERLMSFSYNLIKSNKSIKINMHPELITSMFNLKYQEEERSIYYQDFVPIPVIAPHDNKRLHAQSGTFVLFPIEKKCANKLWKKNVPLCLETLEGAGNFLIKIIFLNPKHISDQLKQIGIKRSMFFPEIPMVSSEIEERYVREIKAL